MERGYEEKGTSAQVNWGRLSLQLRRKRFPRHKSSPSEFTSWKNDVMLHAACFSTKHLVEPLLRQRMKISRGGRGTRIEGGKPRYLVGRGEEGAEEERRLTGDLDGADLREEERGAVVEHLHRLHLPGREVGLRGEGDAVLRDLLWRWRWLV